MSSRHEVESFSMSCCHVCQCKVIVRPSSCYAQALAEIHAAGICLLDICEDNIWIADNGSAAFMDFSMAHEFVPGDPPSPTCNCPQSFFCRVVRNVVFLACKFEPGGNCPQSHCHRTTCRWYAAASRTCHWLIQSTAVHCPPHSAEKGGWSKDCIPVAQGRQSLCARCLCSR